MAGVTFTRRTYDHTQTPPLLTSSTITGDAIQVRDPSPQQYAGQRLVMNTTPMLLFVPDLYNLRVFTTDFVIPGDEIAWAGQVYTVKSVDPIAPDGFVIAARIEVTT